MEIFEHDGKKYADINGKQFFVVRAYSRSDRWGADPCFIQVIGNFALKPEDLQNKGWVLVRTRVGKSVCYTAFVKRDFFYETEAKAAVLVYVGLTTEGSVFLGLRDMARRYGIDKSDAEILRRVKEILDDMSNRVRNYYDFELLTDEGNSGIKAMKVKYSEDSWEGITEEKAKALLEGEDV